MISKIRNVKSILMEHLEAVEEGSERAKDSIDSGVGIIMDPENEQANAECIMEGDVEHPEFLIRDPENLSIGLNDNVLPSIYKQIELHSDEKIEALTLQLDKEQRMVLDIGVDFVKKVKKAKTGSPIPKAPLLVVQGGAGTGKSTLIEAMSIAVEIGKEIHEALRIKLHQECQMGIQREKFGFIK